MPLVAALKHGHLIYGSNDGGDTIHASDEDFNLHMERAAKQLHLAGHLGQAAVAVGLVVCRCCCLYYATSADDLTSAAIVL